MRSEEVIVKQYETKIVTCICDKCGKKHTGEDYHGEFHQCGSCRGDFCEDCLVWYCPDNEAQDEGVGIYGNFCQKCLDEKLPIIQEIDRVNLANRKSLIPLLKQLYPTNLYD